MAMKTKMWAAGLMVTLGWCSLFPAYASETSELLRDRQRAASALKEKNPQRAIKVLEPWIKKRPDDIELANDYALALAQMGKLDQAREVLEEALNKNPQTGAAFNNLREILSQQAAISYAKAMGKKPPNTQLTLRGSMPAGAEPPIVLAQAEPRPGASLEPPPKAIAKSSAGESKAEAKAEAKSEAKAAATQERPQETKEQRPSAKAEAPARAGDAKSEEAAVILAVQQWAAAWASKDFKRYVAAYSDRFEPQQFPSRAAWEAHRRPRVTRPDLEEVKVSEIRVKLLPGGDAEVKFRQRYEAGNLKLNSVKTAVLTREAGGWKILREEGR
ncbi:MAG: tetratricopeptide repeat protein [Betaproteobacteria bacterium]|nr:tetratricopeptide repeat protein [Betaproteobacteria bacterium]